MRLRDHIHKLEYFCIVVEAGSIRKASEIALIGQPQLTKVIQQLEDCLGVKLLYRSAKGVQTTKEGALLLEQAKKLLQGVDQVEFSIQSTEQDIRGTVRIGTYDSIARYFFPEFIRYLKINRPGLRLTLETGRSPHLLKKLKAQTLDLALVVHPGTIPKTIQHEVVYKDSFGLFSAPNLDSHFTDCLIYFDYSMNETAATMPKLGFIESMVCDNLETVRSLAEQGLGVGLLPHRVARESMISKKLIEFQHPKLKNNSFDEHKIILCSHSKLTTAVEYVHNEAHRFLDLWYER